MLLSCECPIRWKTSAFHLGFEIEDTECLRAVRRYGLFVVDNSDVAKAESLEHGATTVSSLALAR
jgi:hypothetical protein